MALKPQGGTTGATIFPTIIILGLTQMSYKSVTTHTIVAYLCVLRLAVAPQQKTDDGRLRINQQAMGAATCSRGWCYSPVPVKAL